MSRAGRNWRGMSDQQVHTLADNLLAEAEAMLATDWYAGPLTAVVQSLRELARDYPRVWHGRCLVDAEFTERYEIVVLAWKDVCDA